ncbi:MAG: GNAT family N-acetyltransferase [Phycisphaerales bacterium]|nr:GNAT family N-acetyltransferase [Phycisphaerales bacterium]
MEIREDDPSAIDVSELLKEHLEEMAAISPAESMHALNVDGLCIPEITFWTGRVDNELLGCGALLELDSTHGEIKSMRTSNEHLRKGVASRLLTHLIEIAQSRGYTRLSLETGSQPEFGPARVMYARFGFEECDPFAQYKLDPNSVFMSRVLD